MAICARRLFLMLAFGFAASSAAGQNLEAKLVIVTSFSKDLTAPYAQSAATWRRCPTARSACPMP